MQTNITNLLTAISGGVAIGCGTLCIRW